MRSSDRQRVSEALARFPHPVVLQQARWIEALQLVSCAVVGAVGAVSPLWGSPFGLCLVVVALYWLWIIVGKSGQLTLDTEGFAVDTRRVNDWWSWSDVEQFRAEFTEAGSDVWFDLRGGGAVRLRNGFGPSHGAMVSLLQQWQERAVTARATAE